MYEIPKINKVNNSMIMCNDVLYEKRHVHWIRCLVEVANKKGVVSKHHFEYLTNIRQDDKTIEQCIEAGRDRWHIEESFNEQKNSGFEMQHLFSRSSFTAFCNWYQSLQLAHMIYQFVIRTREFTQLREQQSKQTIRYLWKNLCMVISTIDLQDFTDLFDHWIATPRQVRLC